MHDCECVDPCCDVIEHDPGSFREPFQLAHRRGLDDVEGSEKYKTREESFPCEGGGDQSDELSGDFVDDDELRIFGSGGAGDLGSGRDANQSDEDCQSDDNGGAVSRVNYVG